MSERHETPDTHPIRGQWQCPLTLTEEEVIQLRTTMIEHKRIMKALFDDNGDKGLVVMFRDFITAENVRRNIRAGNWRAAKWIAVFVSPFLITAATWAVHEAAPIVQYMYQDYLKHHPDLGEELRKMSHNPEPVLSFRRNPSEDALQ